MSNEVVTTVGRIVWGNPTKEKPVIDTYSKQQRLDKSGNPMTAWSFGVAFSKAEFTHVHAVMQQAVGELFPQGAPTEFAWKITDGDGQDKKGMPFASRTGYAGCYILAISTSGFAPKIVKNENGAYVDWRDIKTGDFVRIALRFKAHAETGRKPGIYVNPDMVEFVGYGEAISSGPDAMTVFGGQAVALPVGASSVPVAPAGPLPVVPAAAPAAPAAAPAAPVVGFTQPATIPVAPVGGQPVPPVAAQPVAAPGTMTASPTNAAPPAHDFVANAGTPGYPPAG